MTKQILASGSLYSLTFPNGKVYIGITMRTVKARFTSHVQQSRTGKSKCAVHHAIAKYGKESVKIATIANASYSELVVLEVKAIAEMGTRYPHGYNLTDGGEGSPGFIMTAEHKEKLRAVWTGRTHTKESLERMSKSRIGFAHTAESRAKISATMRAPEMLARISPAGRVHSAETIAKRVAKTTGQTRSAETKEKMRLAQLGKTASAETKAKIGAASASRSHSAETKALMSAVHSGKVRTAEHCKNISEARKGRPLGPMSEATKEKIRSAHKGRAKSPEAVANQIASRTANRLAKSLAA